MKKHECCFSGNLETGRTHSAIAITYTIAIKTEQHITKKQ